ncbi:MAG: sulfatase-like hydrolase/transferase [Phycisphaerae bacterium]|jgi:N-acetylglucosamine-6-sulfatase
MKRRTFLKQCVTGAAALSAGYIVSAMARPEKRPNFIFILTDDQRWDAMGFMGKYPWLKTPNIDRIRQEGMHFKNAFVTHSICSPSRASFLTGTYSHIHGVIQNESRDYDFNKTPSFAQILEKHGYNTAFLGKWHLAYGNQPRPGFKYWFSFDAQGVYENCVLNENGREFTSKGYITDVLNAKTVDYIKEQDSDTPFALYLSHKAVHQPFTPAPRHASQYSDVKLPEPPNFNEDIQSKPEWLAHSGMKGIYRTKTPGSYIKLEEKGQKPFDGQKKIYIDYYRAISAVDEGIANIYDTLETKGMLDNTVIIFAGDNGYFLGEHSGRLDKRLMYEESLRIPVVMRYPKMIKKGSSTDEMVLNIDLAPTLLDLAGIKVPSYMQGRSWRPLFNGTGRNWRNAFLYEYFVDLTPAVPTMIGVRTKEWKLIHYPDINDIDELYDLVNDPFEKKNLILEPAFENKKKELMDLIEKLKDETGYNKSAWKANPVNHIPKRAGSGLVMQYDFHKIKNNIIEDSSGRNNHALLLSAGAGEKDKLHCSGGCIASAVFNNTKFARGPFAFDITFKPESDGIVAAWGDQNNGFAVFVEEGMPAFAYRANGSLFIVDADRKYTGKLVRVTGSVCNGKAQLFIDGRKVSELAVGPFYWMNEPTGKIHLGCDEQKVLSGIMSDGFTGYVSRLRMYDNMLTSKQISQL